MVVPLLVINDDYLKRLCMFTLGNSNDQKVDDRLDAHWTHNALHVDPFISDQSRFLLPLRYDAGYARKRKHCPSRPPDCFDRDSRYSNK